MKTSVKTIMTLAAVTTAAMTLAASRPNFIVILTDDLGYGDFACYGATGIKTPNIEAYGSNLDYLLKKLGSGKGTR